MGLGEIGGDGSVKWKIVHHDRDGRSKPLTHRTRNNVPASLANNDAHRVVIGNPNPIPNQPDLPSDEAEAIDDIATADVGFRIGVPGHFKVSLQYASQSEAEAALKAATVAGRSVVLLVPVVDRNVANSPANLARPNEIIVAW